MFELVLFIFKRVREIAKSDYGFVIAVLSSARNEPAPTGRIFRQVWYFSIFRKIFSRKWKISLKYGKNNGYFARKAMYIYDILLH